ncbi:recombinase RecX [Flavobacterium sp. NST-5]|uniref:Regulatory protein RecX n=1 Tax=Flavobacterium ichthyis TaxID=2698827 RepID=A0ABW9Z942_9FLAO|nr:regulatory protein RecX [Flavobacterium ichthyis]NBL64691.1 recombinase RecX [Flavobacterium ichthyis]
MPHKSLQIPLSYEEILRKAEYFCVYQDRCHQEVLTKLKSLTTSQTVIDNAIVHLIENNFLNEERFACSFARGKHRIKNWGKIRIVAELKARQISKYAIDKALKEFSQEEYFETFEKLANKTWNNLSERDSAKKKAKFTAALLRKGYESHLVFDKLNELMS